MGDTPVDTAGVTGYVKFIDLMPFYFYLNSEFLCKNWIFNQEMLLLMIFLDWWLIALWELDQIVICGNHLIYKDEVIQAVTHELIHAYDDCRAANLDWGNAFHQACSEVNSSFYAVFLNSPYYLGCLF